MLSKAPPTMPCIRLVTVAVILVLFWVKTLLARWVLVP